MKIIMNNYPVKKHYTVEECNIKFIIKNLVDKGVSKDRILIILDRIFSRKN
uniref:Uncharacterized protein n=1 Tax=viral metagenome TaxID=1070528 RepID=A0A6C0CX98_9ZZZZ